MALRAFSHHLLPFIFTILPPGEEEDEASFILLILQPGKLEEIWQGLFHRDGNLKFGICNLVLYQPLILMNKSYILPFCRTFESNSEQGLAQNFWFQESRDPLAETSRAVREQHEESHLTISGELQEKEGLDQDPSPYFPSFSSIIGGVDNSPGWRAVPKMAFNIT